MEISLLKVHGSSNTFYLYETEQEDSIDLVSLTKWLCLKNNLDGADGLLLVLPSKHCDAKMRVINADGSEASMCGNGLRCVARYVCEKLGVDEAVIETMKADLTVRKFEPIYDTIPTYGVTISPVSFNLDSLPMYYKDQNYIKHQLIEELSPSIHFTAVSVPNPHLIGVVDKEEILNSKHQFELAQYLNSENPYCVDGVNVSYLYPINNQSIYVRTYERGVGFTNACGTAMTASALVAKINNLVSSNIITVFNPGGFVKCIVDEQDSSYNLKLIGNATFIASNILLVDEAGKYEWVSQQSTNEQEQYESLTDYVQEQLKDVL